MSAIAFTAFRWFWRLTATIGVGMSAHDVLPMLWNQGMAIDALIVGASMLVLVSLWYAEDRHP